MKHYTSQTRCEFEIDLENDAGKVEFSVLIQRAEDPVIATIPYVGYSDVPVATLEIKPIGWCQLRFNAHRHMPSSLIIILLPF